jgi:2',3'-cyclic-nucleotide 2'-phosphodiesterase (5'-nucleotidase family)
MSRLKVRQPARRFAAFLLMFLGLGGGWTIMAGSPAAPQSAPAGQEVQHLDLILSAETRGELLPCGHCRVAAGGLARRAALMQACRDTADFLIAAEGGDMFRPGDADPEEDAFLIGLLARLQYSVLGVGEEDLRRGVSYLKGLVAPHAGMEWVSANIVDANTGKPVFAPYLLRRAGSTVVGFTSCLEPELWKEYAADSPELKVADPVEKVAEAVAAMRKECQLVVCLVHMRTMPLRSFLVQVEGIDVATDSHGPRIEHYPQRIGEARMVFFAGPRGRFVNWVDVELLPEGPNLRAGRTHYLKDGAPEDSTITREIHAFLGTREPRDPKLETDEEGVR